MRTILLLSLLLGLLLFSGLMAIGACLPDRPSADQVSAVNVPCSGHKAQDLYIVREANDTEGPSITEIEIEPGQPEPHRDVKVKVWVDDPSGVSNVTLSYSVDEGVTWENVTMTKVGDHYEGLIPGQPGGTFVKFRIYARDGVGNWSVSPDYRFQVRPVASISGLVGIVPLVAVAVVGRAIVRRRKSTAGQGPGITGK